MKRLGKITVFIAALSMITIHSASGQDYRWPLKITPQLSSQFGDYRKGHWHAGIDISTRGKPGFKVYAIDDGYIFRIKSSFWGYGKALYLKLNDGRYAVYGHLTRFSHHLEDYLRRQQVNSKNYYQDIFFKPGQYPVKKGEYIALSGQTGSGPAHLHLEIRDGNNLPVNPLRGFYKITDNRPPVIDYLVVKRFRNVGFSNYYDFEFLKVGGQSPIYSVADTVDLYNHTVFSLAGFDPNSSYNYGLYGVSLVLDGIEIFSFKHDIMDYSSGNQIDYVKDHALKSLCESIQGVAKDNDKNVFYKLYIQPYDQQLFYGDYSYPAGIIYADSLDSSVHELKIIIKDVNGNVSEIKLFLKKPDLPKPQIEAMTFFDDTLVIKSSDINQTRTIQVQKRKNKISSYETVWTLPDLFDGTISLNVPDTWTDYRLRLLDDNSSFSPWVEFAPETTGEQVQAFADYLDVVISGEEQILANDIPLDHFYNLPLPNGYKKVLVPVPVKNGYFEISLKDNPETHDYYVFNSEGTFYSSDSLVSIEINDSHLYDPVIVKISALKYEDNGHVFDIYPENLLLRNNADIEVNHHRLNVDPGKSSLYYYWPAKAKWVYIGEKSNESIKGETGGGGKFGIFEDTKGPFISRVNPENQSIISDNTPYLSCKIDDDLSGIKQETQLEMTIDGIWVPAYYDIDTKEFGYQVRNPLKRATHMIRIRAIDNQGNESNRTSRFTVR